MVAIFVVLALVGLDRLLFRQPGFEIDDALSVAGHHEVYFKIQSEHAVWTLQQQKEVFEWALRSENYIFWVSILLSLSGVAFAFWQFALASQFDRSRGEADEMEVKTELASLSFKSRSVASLVLLVSLAYMAVYVRFLHPVDLIDTGSSVHVGAGATPPMVAADSFGAPVPGYGASKQFAFEEPEE